MEKPSKASVRCIIRHSLTDVTLFGAENNGVVAITGLLFGSAFGGKKAHRSSDPLFLGHAASIKKFLDGKQHNLSGIPIDVSWCSPFTRKVYKAARKLAWGETISYTELARRVGNPKAARAAASAMRNNRYPLIIPCHRVIKSDGTIGGFMGKQTGKAVALKKSLLKRELPNYFRFF